MTTFVPRPTVEIARSWRIRTGEVRISMFEMILWLALWYYLTDLVWSTPELIERAARWAGNAFEWKSWVAYADSLTNFELWPKTWTEPITACVRITITILMIAYVLRIRRHAIRYLGFETPRWRQDLRFTLILTLLAGAVYALLLAALLYIASAWPEIFGGRAGQSPVEVLWWMAAIRKLGWYDILSLVLLYPVMEEIWFRGWMYPVVRAHFSAPLAITFVAIIFAAAHPWPQLSQLIGGFVFTYAYEKRPTLYIPIALHMMGNGTLVVLSWAFAP